MNDYQSLKSWSSNSKDKKILQVHQVLQDMPDPNVFAIGSVERVVAERKLKALKKEAEELGYNESLMKELIKEVGIHELGLGLGVSI